MTILQRRTPFLPTALLSAAVLLLAALAASPASAAPQSRSASSGQVTATVTWDETASNGTRDVRVWISRAGAELLSQAAQPGCDAFCWDPPDDEPVRIRDLNADGEPEVLVDLYSGGAHCCSIVLIYEYDAATNSYERLRRNFGNAGYVLRDAGGDARLEFFSGDDRFSYLYTSYLESARPLLVYRYQAGALVDVTRAFRSQLIRHRKSLARHYKRLRRERLDVRGVLAAWQADNYLLGSRAAARGWKRLRVAARRGELRPRGFNGGPSGKRYLRSLRRYLARFDYVP